MKRQRLYFAALLVAVLAACTTLGVPTPQTFNEKEAAAISSVTAARNTTLSLLNADKISGNDAQNIQTQLDTTREAIVIADSIHQTDPTQAENRLTAIITGLNAITAYLATRGH